MKDIQWALNQSIETLEEGLKALKQRNAFLVAIQKMYIQFGDPKGYGDTEGAKAYREVLTLAGIEVEP